MHTATFCSRNAVHKVVVVPNEPKEYSARYSLIQVIKLLIKERMKSILYCEVQERRIHYAVEISIIFSILYT